VAAEAGAAGTARRSPRPRPVPRLAARDSRLGQRRVRGSRGDAGAAGQARAPVNGAGTGAGIGGGANMTKAPPCMRWRGLARPRRTRSASCLAARRRGPPARARHPREAPVSRLLPRSGVAPGRCPFPTVNVFLLRLAEPRKSPREFIFTLFGVHTLFTEFGRLSARHGRYPPLDTQPVHRLPGVTQRIPAHGRRM